jgi:hypothetical protein
MGVQSRLFDLLQNRGCATHTLLRGAALVVKRAAQRREKLGHH